MDKTEPGLHGKWQLNESCVGLVILLYCGTMQRKSVKIHNDNTAYDTVVCARAVSVKKQSFKSCMLYLVYIVYIYIYCDY